ncbi:hypothetical protein M011DRAFT_513503 [Sporormia fimetaria CBS 119925]|uniref:Uncharacterized protein n=1 Tax=Sporormia fimetaria CBS 119925 TaxID=1340428 RepID=A0A6A6VFU7_9PLEO|nr:hypothetical protein M011DRAFT_513503 [Sporormia fimetaria CBS 119925]
MSELFSTSQTQSGPPDQTPRSVRRRGSKEEGDVRPCFNGRQDYARGTTSQGPTSRPDFCDEDPNSSIEMNRANKQGNAYILSAFQELAGEIQVSGPRESRVERLGWRANGNCTVRSERDTYQCSELPALYFIHDVWRTRTRHAEMTGKAEKTAGHVASKAGPRQQNQN